MVRRLRRKVLLGVFHDRNSLLVLLQFHHVALLVQDFLPTDGGTQISTGQFIRDNYAMLS